MTHSPGVQPSRRPLEAAAGTTVCRGVEQGTADAANARGAVTAEFAVALPAVLALLAMLLAGAAAGMTQLRIEEGARAGARALARGDDPAAVERTVRTLAGGSAAASVAADGGWFSITVTDRVPGPLGSSIPWTLTARSSTRSEMAGTGAVNGAGAGGSLTDGKANR
ncbi:MAG TPA: TadE family type IV pilus minor pilin [Arthrobacter sp.]|jgi:Flp pilus assembly protein TadG|nr:TadE family type IV pilus minor pilin [Arthrobacter sp.]